MEEVKQEIYALRFTKEDISQRKLEEEMGLKPITHEDIWNRQKQNLPVVRDNADTPKYQAKLYEKQAQLVELKKAMFASPKAAADTLFGLGFEQVDANRYETKDARDFSCGIERRNLIIQLVTSPNEVTDAIQSQVQKYQQSVDMAKRTSLSETVKTGTVKSSAQQPSGKSHKLNVACYEGSNGAGVKVNDR
jgi:hypothetical protein